MGEHVQSNITKKRCRQLAIFYIAFLLQKFLIILNPESLRTRVTTAKHWIGLIARVTQNRRTNSSDKGFF